MKKYIFVTLILTFLLNLTNFAQRKRVDSLITQYQRNSIYSIVIEHPGFMFGEEIKQEFFKIPVSDKYNEHNLSVRSFLSNNEDNQNENIQAFLNRNYVSKRVVARWFNRNIETGVCDMNLVKTRGYYDASIMDYKIANQTARGTAILADAGEQLIGNTFVIVNDISYIDKEKRAKKTGTVFKAIADISLALGGVAVSVNDIKNIGEDDEEKKKANEEKSKQTKELSESIADLSNSISDITDLIAGFTVNITSYLYQLEWTEEHSSIFFNNYYLEKVDKNNQKKTAFENDSNIFSLKYVGKFNVKSTKTVLRGTQSNEEVIRKVCARALDENIVGLQRKFEAFKIKSPIIIEGDSIYSPIGLKEGISSMSKFEVLEKILNDDGKTHYKRVGIIKPVYGKIWDNRFMAMEEEAENSNLKFTQFKKVSGTDFYSGMMIRQIF